MYNIAYIKLLAKEVKSLTKKQKNGVATFAVEGIDYVEI